MIFDFVLPFLDDLPKDCHILEVGCGSGLHSALLTEVGKVSATELKSTVFWLGDTVDQTRSRVFSALARGPIDFRYNDGLSIPFDDESFDVVFHNSVIEHVPDIIAFNQEVRRVLKPGGLCICITGTPALCRFRYFKSHVLRFPMIAGYGVAATVRDKFFSTTRLVKKLNARVRTWHFQPTRERLQSIIDDHYPGTDQASAIEHAAIRDMYSSLRHIIREPEYNRILIDRLAARHSVTPRSLLLQIADHFRSPWNDLRFRTTPSTHSQHTSNFRTEIAEWKVENWQRAFADSGFVVTDVIGYRYQQAVDLTPCDRANAWIAYHSLPLARAASRSLPTNFASEIILVARNAASNAAD